jgi:hypothetical protein
VAETAEEEAKRRALAAEQRFRDAERARRDVEGLTEWELIGSAPGVGHVRHPMEMGRRLMVSIGALNEELAAFRRSSDTASRRLVSLTRVLVLLTVVLVALTGVVVWLTIKLLP